MLTLLCAEARQSQDSITVSLITCWPGKEVYELCGHEAVRVRGNIDGHPIDSVWNYGMFDYTQPNFVYRFVKGETDYMVGSYPFSWFMPEYVQSGRKVVEQDLSLNNEEAKRLLALLREEALPQNCTYRYNYVKDNCATRVADRLDEAVGGKIIYPDSINYGTFREEMRAYHVNYPWYQFGIDLALGSGIDYPIDGREEMFVPVEMKRKADFARLPDGRPLVKETRTLNEGSENAVLAPTPWWITPVFVAWAFFAVIMLLCWLQWSNDSIYRWLYSLWFGILGLAGFLVTFLVFGSTHEATSPNILLLWLNPLQLVIAVGVWFRRKWHAATVAMAYVNIILLVVMLMAWPFQSQSANPAFFPLMFSTLGLAVTYAILRTKLSLNIIKKKNEEVCDLGVSNGRRIRRGSSTGNGKTATRRRNRR